MEETLENHEAAQDEVPSTEELQEVVDQQEEKQEDVAQYEAQARKEGWRPKEDWVRAGKDPSQFIDAKQFVENGRTIVPLLNEKVKRLEKTLNEQRETTRKLIEVSKTIKQQTYEQAKAELMREQEKRVAEGDIEGWRRIEAEKEKLRPLAEEPVFQEQQTINPVFEQWKANNTWYDMDPQLKRVADNYGAAVAARNPQLQGVAFFEEVERQVKADFAHKFTNANRQTVSSVETAGRTATAQVTHKGFATLPSEAKSAFASFVEQGVFTNDAKGKEMYFKMYTEAP